MPLRPPNHHDSNRNFIPLAGGLFLALVILVGVEVWPDNKNTSIYEPNTIMASVEKSLSLSMSEISGRAGDLKNSSGVGYLSNKLAYDTERVKEGFVSLKNSLSGLVAGATDKKSLTLSRASSAIHPVQTASVSMAFENISRNINAGFKRFDNFTAGIGLNIKFFFNQTKERWQNFFAGDDEQQPALTETEINTIREEIKAEVLNEIRNEIANLEQASGQPFSKPEIIQSRSGQGVVVVPSGGDAPSNEEIKSQLRNMFSDETIIEFDSSGQSGVITPVFRDKRGDDFIFLLTPINR